LGIYGVEPVGARGSMQEAAPELEERKSTKWSFRVWGFYAGGCTGEGGIKSVIGYLLRVGELGVFYSGLIGVIW